MLFCTLFVGVSLVVPSSTSGFANIYDAIPELASLHQTSTARLRPYLGGLNMTTCCLKAVQSTFQVNNGTLLIARPAFLSPDMTVSTFLSAMDRGQFPCGATFDGDLAGAPLIKASYQWSSENCPGWQISQTKKHQQWIAPFVGFILPCLVFCLSIPRSRKLEVDENLFAPTPHYLWNLILTPLGAIAAVAIVTADTLIWLGLCFAFAGPMILSGIFEAFLDHRILNFVAEGIDGGSLGRTMGSRLLYIILIGNLNFEWDKVAPAADSMDPSDDLETILQGRNPAARLQSMIDMQNSFGASVGAPIVFFAGSFVYTVFDTLSNLGNNDNAHALAFGLWWMMIPHVAITSSLLLGGNNPLAFQIAVGAHTREHPPAFKIFTLSYRSRYKTEWMWLRGRSKYLWIRRTLRIRHASEQLAGLQSAMVFSVFDWAKIVFLTMILVFVPFILAFLLSFYTPQIGLSCRSATFLVYFITQVFQVTLWVWVLVSCNVCPRGTLHTPTGYTTKTMCNPLRCITYWLLATIFGVSSIVTAIGGTIMQLVGVYRNCLCALPVNYWSNRYDTRAWISLGSNRSDVIEAAQTWWIGLSSVGVGFLCLSAYWGWWYQRRLRAAFRDLAEKIQVLEEVTELPGVASPDSSASD